MYSNDLVEHIRDLKDVCEVTYLTNDERRKFDYTGAGKEFVDKFFNIPDITSWNGKLDTRLFRDGISYDQFLDKWWAKEDAMYSSSHHDYYQYNQYCRKFVGPQGMSFSVKDMLDYYGDSFRNARRNPTFKAVLTGRDILMQAIRNCLDKYGYPQPVSVTFKNAASALPVCGKKGDFRAECYGVAPHHPIYPNLPGQRFMRNKRRTINQDAVFNVRQLEESLASCRLWLRTYLPEYFGAWLDDKYWVAPNFTRYVANSYAVETDYKSMDTHYQPQLAREVVYPIYELLLPMEKQHFLMYVDALWSQPVYFGDFMLCGLHDLFSGQEITNDFETITQVCESLGVIYENGLQSDVRVTVHQGDDQAALFSSEKSARRYLDEYITEANLNGLDMEPSKCAVRKSSVMFCRKWYYPTAKRGYNPVTEEYMMLGAYPSTLAINSIVTPERSSDTVGQLAVATYQRLDNCVGSPDFYVLCDHVKRYTKLPSISISEKDIEQYSSKDWWFRVYGEKWDPNSSTSFRYLNR